MTMICNAPFATDRACSLPEDHTGKHHSPASEGRRAVDFTGSGTRTDPWRVYPPPTPEAIAKAGAEELHRLGYGHPIGKLQPACSCDELHGDPGGPCTLCGGWPPIAEPAPPAVKLRRRLAPQTTSALGPELAAYVEEQAGNNATRDPNATLRRLVHEARTLRSLAAAGSRRMIECCSAKAWRTGERLHCDRERGHSGDHRADGSAWRNGGQNQ